MSHQQETTVAQDLATIVGGLYRLALMLIVWGGIIFLVGMMWFNPITQSVVGGILWQHHAQKTDPCMSRLCL
ncbi:hypothetical protein ACC685_33345 [Rhizobium ruizarguesonis]